MQENFIFEQDTLTIVKGFCANDLQTISNGR